MRHSGCSTEFLAADRFALDDHHVSAGGVRGRKHIVAFRMIFRTGSRFALELLQICCTAALFVVLVLPALVAPLSRLHDRSLWRMLRCVHNHYRH